MEYNLNIKSCVQEKRNPLICQYLLWKKCTYSRMLLSALKGQATVSKLKRRGCCVVSRAGRGLGPKARAVTGSQ